MAAQEGHAEAAVQLLEVRFAYDVGSDKVFTISDGVAIGVVVKGKGKH